MGFDSDDDTIFARQLEFIEQTDIAWAMAGVLQAPPTTALFDRMKREGRLIEDSEALTNFSAPNFRTVLPLPVLLRGLSNLLVGLYEPERYFQRAYRSLEGVEAPGGDAAAASLGMGYNLRVLAASAMDAGNPLELQARVLEISAGTAVPMVAGTGEDLAGVHGPFIGAPFFDLRARGGR